MVLNLDRVPATGIDFPSLKDIVFYEIAISKENAYLVTGNCIFLILVDSIIEIITEKG